jgi:hypothetical protein
MVGTALSRPLIDDIVLHEEAHRLLAPPAAPGSAPPKQIVERLRPGRWALAARGDCRRPSWVRVSTGAIARAGAVAATASRS